MTATLIDPLALRDQVRDVYRDVAREPDGEFHFETGPALATRLGYPDGWLDLVPAGALASFAGVGHMLDLAEIQPRERVLDLGAGSGTDAFIAGTLTGTGGRVLGIDMTDAQVHKARRMRDNLGITHITFVEGLIESPPVDPASFDVVISNGVINLVPDKRAVFRAAASVLRPGGRLAVADIVSAHAPIAPTRRNAELWAACVAGAVPYVEYQAAIEAAGLVVERVRPNPAFRFLSPRAQATADKYGVASVTVLASKPR